MWMSHRYHLARTQKVFENFTMVFRDITILIFFTFMPLADKYFSKLSKHRMQNSRLHSRSAYNFSYILHSRNLTQEAETFRSMKKMMRNENESKLLPWEICFEIGYLATSCSNFRKNISANAASKKYFLQSIRYELLSPSYICTAACICIDC